MSPIPSWFHNRIVEGIQLLHSLHLDGRPAAEVITLTATGWIDVLWRAPRAWAEGRDTERLVNAFFSLSRQVDRWPAPRQLLDHLPPAREVPALAEAVPPMSAARRAQLAEVRRKLASRLVAIPQVSGGRVDTSLGGGCGMGADQGRFEPEPQADADPAGCEKSI